MKKLRKILVVVTICVAIFISGISVCAIDPYTQIQGWYGSKSGTYNGEISWDLQVTTWCAYSHGQILSPYAGWVECYVFLSTGEVNQSISKLSNSAVIYGDGNGAEVYFTVYYPYTIGQYGNGSNINYDSSESWNLGVCATGASSDGSFINGHYGYVVCTVTGSWGTNTSTQNNSNSIVAYGVGNSAEVSFMDLSY